MISCFTVTQEGRLEVLARAVADFCAQTVREKELVILHDAGPAFHESVSRLAVKRDDAQIRIARVPVGRTLGALRNAAIEETRGEYVCQWDDDDRYHPRRMELQLEALRAAKSDCSFLSDQLHLFADQREMYWDDWHDKPYPLNVVPGTLLARRDSLPRYPDSRRGEDTDLIVAMLRQGWTVARLRELGYLYVYVFDGRNTFDRAHHASISHYHRFRGARLIRLEAALRARVAEYDPPLGPFVMPHEGGRLEFA